MDLNTGFLKNDFYSSNWDVVVIGAGAAGLMTSLELPSKLKILLLNRNTSKRSSSRWAQGGMAAVTRVEDSEDIHALDTIKAGAGLCDPEAVQMFVESAPRLVDRLLKLGMEFDRTSGKLSTTLEAAHTHRRVLHVKDRTGKALVDVLNEQVDRRDNVLHQRGIRVTQIWVEGGRCLGVQVLDGPALRWINAKAVVLATGGGGHLFANTTNPIQAAGEGIALAWRAGAVIEDLEFFQFHPTALKLNGAPSFLISEALRGEGAVLVDSLGESPVAQLEGKDLASRDQVSRALFKAMQKQKVDHVGLDVKSIGVENVEARFPSIFQRCRELGLDPLKEVIPVAPSAHYWMGGVYTNLKAQTNITGLFAIGEVACTGLHGANRLASNSLMECLVFANQMRDIELNNFQTSDLSVKNSSFKKVNLRFSKKQGTQYLIKEIEKLRQLCWREAGVDRSQRGMSAALAKVKRDYENLLNEPLLNLVFSQSKNAINQFDEIARRDLNLLLDLTNRQMASALMLEACLFREESRGGHFRDDFPNSVPFWQCHTRQVKGMHIHTRPVSDMFFEFKNR
ncbi:L-aspartate oxidase [Prochlorococcus marinus]|uniref:L-aspartate oxidase n=1 Tax=Prochlorococcus marinus XMU1408 TaxID=2213228 RepID=A0A318R7U5_PROMR|nr:L-aspartate oxidase [Prochlorococcus marinus]MBW3041162.1 L-aspartate oxidase [Prochlorococcus marinus str. XMU1408]PYE03760.1 L-aspartate oxidase [Prochlorococcus marinus XMU1408]